MLYYIRVVPILKAMSKAYKILQIFMSKSSEFSIFLT
jgi:hypothetical protein